MKIPESPPLSSTIAKEIDKDKFHKLFIRTDVQEFIEKANEKYYPWSKFKFIRPIPKNTNHKELWFILYTLRTIGAKKLVINEKYSSKFKFRYNIPNNVVKRLNQFDLNMGGYLLSESIIPEEDKTKYLISSIMEEAIASSILEGAISTREKAKELLRSARKPKTSDEKMIVNNYNTIRQLSKYKKSKLTSEFILKIHKWMTEDTLDDSKYEGVFRNNNDIDVSDGITGQQIYKPPDYKIIPEIIDSICDFINVKKQTYFIHPIIKASILHFLIGYLHPFMDGNGRTARALFYWHLLSNGYWLMEYMSISRLIIRSPMQYARAYLYTENDDNDLTYFINYKLKMVDFALTSLKKYIKRKIKEKHDIFELRKIYGINDRKALIIKWLSDQPQKLLTIREVQIRLDVSYETARKDILDLKKIGLITHNNSVKRDVSYFRTKNFERLIESSIKRELKNK